ncbi:MAG TPA: penicillin acylase family protein [Thermoleophilaceae bacterium]|jgi:acyl-homoserine lactone acylase PvdQ
MVRRSLIAAVALALATAIADTGAAARDYSRTALNVIPSGQYGSVPPPDGADRQARMYDELTPLFANVTTPDLTRYFKSARLGTAGQGPLREEAVPRPGVKVVRDGFNVPHITGQTVDDVTWGAGWVVAEDRELLLEQARYNARVAAVDVPNLRALTLITQLRSFTPSAQTEEEIGKQTRVLRAQGQKGRRLLHDIDVYLEGINAFYEAAGRSYARWTRNDIYAVNALKGQFLGEGGGGEHRSSMLLDGLRDHLGARRGEAVWTDLRQRDDPETAVSVGGRFPYGIPSSERRGNVVLDNGSFKPVEFPQRADALPLPLPLPKDGPGPQHPKAPPAEPPRQASNILMIAGDRAPNGHPLFVGGPQIGYFYPGLTLEMDLHGPGIDVRGATSVPFPGYMLIGRGEDFAWTLTSAGGDIVDVYAETLCDGSDVKYVYRGSCRDMTPFDAGVLRGSGGEPDRELVFSKTVHGPVIGYATAGGRRVALSRKRSSYGRDTVDQVFFQDLTRGNVASVRDFFRAALQTPQTFNAFYADDRDIGMLTTGLLPQRAAGVDPGLPTDGRGRFEWRGFLPDSGHPRGVNPRSGYLVNWNNKPARGFSSADSAFGQGAIQRDDMLVRRIRRQRRHDLGSVVAAMNVGATQDVRSVELLPVLAAVLRRGTAPSERATAMLAQLEDWRRAGSSRLDRDLDGKVDHPGAAIMDTAFPRLADAVMVPRLGQALADQLDQTLMRRFDLPPSGQYDGWHQYMDKDLRTLLGRPVRGPFRNRYCGRGDLARCATDLWAALEAAGDQLAAAQGGDPAAWRADATRERITFSPGVLPYTMRYTNRPSGIQQVVEFRGHRPR